MFLEEGVVLAVIAATAAIGAARGLRRDINRADEGYLVYGVQALMRGETPVRDFRAYDPGRYLWCALFALVLGPGFLSARVAMTVLSTAGAMTIGLLVLSASADPLLGCLSGILGVLWAQPRHKRGEALVSSLAVLGLFLLIVWPDASFLAGALIALGLLYGHNLAVYMAASGIIFLVAHVCAGLPVPVDFAQIVLGFVIGYAPVVCLAAVRRGTIEAYWTRKVATVLRRGAANLKLPLPWLFTPAPAHLKSLGRARSFSVRCLFTLMPVAYAVAILSWILAPSIRDSSAGPLILAASAAGLAFFHHAMSRADLSHVCQAIAPFVALLGAALALPPALGTNAFVLLMLIGFTVWLLWVMPDFAREWGKHGPTRPLRIGRHSFLLEPAQYNHYQSVMSVIGATQDEQPYLFSAPTEVALLALLNARSAVYDTFPVYPATESAQSCMQKELNNHKPQYAVISSKMVDGRSELKFENNYSKVYKFILFNYEPILHTESCTVFQINAI